MRVLLAASVVSGLLALGAAADDQVGFLERTSYDVGGLLNDVELVDVDGDGDQDILAASSGGGGLYATVLLRNDGSGRFGLPATVATGYTHWLAPADLDGDGDVDLVAGGGAPAVALNDGTGVFAIGTVPGVGYWSSIAAADLDGDLDIDVVGSANIGLLALAWNDGAGAFTSSGLAYAAVAGEYPMSIAAIDLTGDARPELVMPWRLAKEIRVYVNDGTGGFSAGTPVTLPDHATAALLAADLDGDGDQDVVVGVSDQAGSGTGGENTTASSGAVLVLRNEGGTLVAWQTLPLTAWPTDVEAADMDGDGDQDLVVLGSNAGSNPSLVPGVYVFLDEGASFGSPTRFDPPAVGATRGADVADLDADGAPDVVSTSYGQRLGVMLQSALDPPGTEVAATVTPGTIREPGTVDVAIVGCGFQPGVVATFDADLGPGALQRVSEFAMASRLDVPAGIGSSDRTVLIRNPDGKTTTAAFALRSLDVSVTGGAVVDAPRPRRDRLRVRGDLVFNQLADVTGFAATLHDLVVRVGSGPDAFEVRVPAGDSGWRSVGAIQRWRGRGPDGARVVLEVDAFARTFAVSIRRASLPAFDGGVIDVAFAVTGGTSRTHRGEGGATFAPSRRGWRL